MDESRTNSQASALAALEQAAPRQRAPSGLEPAGALLLLTLAYLLNFLDRQILGILLPLIKTEFRFTDTDLGFLGGLAFALFYATLAVPIAILADRRSRVWIITISLAVWSIFTIACGYARGFASLFVARLGVGIGEAGGVAPSYSLIADLFPPERRARALAVYSMAVPVGGALGIFLGGEVAAAYGWRVAFIGAGAAGVLLTPVFRLLMRDPPRGRYDTTVGVAAPFREVVHYLARRPSYWLLAVGASLNSMMGYGLILWLPSLFQRSFGMSLVEAARFYSALGLIGGVIGIWAGGALGDRLAKRDAAALGRVPALAALGTLPFYIAGLSFTGTLPVTFLLFLVPGALSLMWLGPILSAVQALCPAAMRTTASAIFLLINNLIGIGAGTALLGALSEHLAAAHGSESLRYAVLYALPLYAMAAAFMLMAARRLGRDLAA